MDTVTKILRWVVAIVLAAGAVATLFSVGEPLTWWHAAGLVAWYIVSIIFVARATEVRK